jgi:hypothetical protein
MILVVFAAMGVVIGVGVVVLQAIKPDVANSVNSVRDLIMVSWILQAPALSGPTDGTAVADGAQRSRQVKAHVGPHTGLTTPLRPLCGLLCL